MEYMDGNFIEAESAGKARYKLWLKGASDYFESFHDFIKHLKIREVKQVVPK
jgi:hypothetical protein